MLDLMNLARDENLSSFWTRSLRDIATYIQTPITNNRNFTWGFFLENFIHVLSSVIFSFKFRKKRFFFSPIARAESKSVCLGKLFANSEMMKYLKRWNMNKAGRKNLFADTVSDRIFVTSKIVCQIGNDFAENPKSPST